MAQAIDHNLSLTERRSYHDRIAQTLQEDRTIAFEEWGHHVSCGSDLLTARHISEKLGEFYLKKGWGQKAVQYFEWAMTLNPEPAERLTDLMKLGEAYLIDHQYPKALEVIEQARHDLTTHGDETSWLPIQIDGLIRMGGVYLKMEALDKARSCFEQARGLIKDCYPDPVREMIIENFQGYLFIQEGKLLEAEKIFTKNFLAWQETLDSETKKHVTNNDLGMTHLLSHHYDKALKQFQTDLLFYKNLGDNLLIARCHYHLAETHAALQQHEKTIQHYKTCAQLCQKSRNMELMLRAYNGLGNVYLRHKDYRNSIHYYRRGLTICENSGEMKSHAAISINIGLIYNLIGEFDQALSYLKPAAHFFQKISDKSAFDWHTLFRGLLELAEVKRKQNDYREAEVRLGEGQTNVSHV